MALAYLEILDATPGGVELLADIGTNVYYQYRIGTATNDAELDSVDFESPLQKYEHGAFAQPLRFRVPASQLPRGSRHLQLVSYRDERRTGPAWSRVVAVQPLALAGPPDEWSDGMLSLRRPRATPFTIPATAAPSIAVRAGTMFDVFREQVAVFVPSMGIGIPVDVAGLVAPVPRAIAEVALVDVASNATLARAETRIADLRDGVPIQLFIAAADLANVPRHTRLCAEITLRWPTQAGVQRARTSLSVVLAEKAFVSAIDDVGGRTLSTDNPEQHRAFWHRIWSWRVPADSEAIRWELDLACRYALQANPAQTTNGRLETRALLDPADPEDLTYSLAGKLKTGLELALDALASLAGEVENLATIRATPACIARLAAQATTRLRAKGKRANETEIWAVPVFEARTITMYAIDATDDDGRVTSARSIEPEFAFPAKVRFITLRSTTTRDESAPFPGFETAADDMVSVERVS